jgi:uncharacterized protein (DUF1330 family)
MVTYLILGKILNPALFAEYMRGHLPTITQYGGRVGFRSIQNTTVHGDGDWDVVAQQEWPDAATFERWWASDEYRPWAKIRDEAVRLSIVRCDGV